MAQLQKGTTYITGDQVTAANLNALVDSGILTPGAVTDQTAKTVPLAADTILLHSAADTALRKTTMTQLFATPQPLGATTPSSVAATTGTFSSTLGVTGVATLGNGAILGTPASGTVTNLTGTASININGTVGATTPSTGAFSTLSATGITTVAAGSAALPAIVSTTGTADTGLWFPAADTIAASTAGTERMRIDSSGNLGIGTATPSTFGKLAILSTGTSTTTAFVNGSSASASNTLSTDYFLPNSFGGLEKSATIGAINPNAGGNNGGALYFSTSLNGTATTPTERMRIDNAGNVLVGVTANTGVDTGVQRLVVTGIAGGGGGALGLISDSLGRNIIITDSSKTYVGAINISSTAMPIGTNSAIPLTFLTNSSERMRISSAGNVGIGTTNPATLLHLSAENAASALKITATTGTNASYMAFTNTGGNAYVGRENSAGNSLGSVVLPYALALVTETAYPIEFVTNNVTRAIIDSSGNVGIGMTSPSCKLQTSIASNNNDISSILAANNYAGTSGLVTFISSLGDGTNSVSNTNCFHLKAISQGSAVYYLYGNGTTSFTSDSRLKKNIESARNGYLEDLCKLRLVKYNWNTSAEGDSKELGLIAQEVEQVFPNLVQDAVDKIQGFKPKVLKASVLPMMMLKAIQELKLDNDSLRKRLAALESK